jgi:hypothetical protein
MCRIELIDDFNILFRIDLMDGDWLNVVHEFYELMKELINENKIKELEDWVF